MYAQLMKNFEKQLKIYTEVLRIKSKDEKYSKEDLNLLFDNVKEEWRVFDSLITKMFLYELLTEEEYNKVYQDGYKKYREYFNVCTDILTER
jgi:hypothetical protein